MRVKWTPKSTLKSTVTILTLWASILGAVLVAPVDARAQGEVTDRPAMFGPRKQLATIIYAGLGGAILGLSTLSFYSRPQDKLSNIAIGFAVGVIGGTIAVTYNAATNPSDFYGASWQPENTFESLEELSRRQLGPAPEFFARGAAPVTLQQQALSASYELATF
ncbi:MAG: hypothetical protein RBT63_05535 [Bdellovibrionales bacterium]|jgi:hypothetical protein|nr:hypothetical protein [Bdellovibrionales bacterium]